MAEYKSDKLEEENKALKEKITHLERELSMASNLKYHMMPNVYPAFPDVKGLDIYADSIQLELIGGDFFDFFRIDADHIGIVMADIFDGGVAAALYMVAFKILLSSQMLLGNSLNEKVENINDQLCWNNEDNLSLSVWYGIYEISTGRVSAVNCGHERPFILRNGEAVNIEEENVSYLMGVMEGMKYESFDFTINEGDKLLIYTDGVINSKGGDGTEFGLKRMISAFEETDGKSAMDSVGLLERSFSEFINKSELTEDASFLCIYRNGGVA